MIATGLREIAPGDDAELEGERLEEDRHEIGDHDHREEREIVFRAAGQIGGPIAGIHVADGDQKAGPGEGEQLAQETGGRWDHQAAMDLGETRQLGLGAEAGLAMNGPGSMELGMTNLVISCYESVNSKILFV